MTAISQFFTAEELLYSSEVVLVWKIPVRDLFV